MTSTANRRSLIFNGYFRWFWEELSTANGQTSLSGHVSSFSSTKQTVVVASRLTTFRSSIIGSSCFVISDDSWGLTPPIETANTTGLKGVGGSGMSVTRLTSRTVSLLLPLNATQSRLRGRNSAQRASRGNVSINLIHPRRLFKDGREGSHPTVEFILFYT